MDPRSHIFLIGPGGIGKSTFGPQLAADVNADFVDLDLAVCERIAPIPELIEAEGYAAYCAVSSTVAARLVEEAGGRLVMATSSGFLTHDDQPQVVAANLGIVRRAGRSVLVLPDADLDAAAELIADRQARRWGAETRDHWLAVTRRRLPTYRDLAGIEVVAADTSEETSRRVLAALGS